MEWKGRRVEGEWEEWGGVRMRVGEGELKVIR